MRRLKCAHSLHKRKSGHSSDVFYSWRWYYNAQQTLFPITVSHKQVHHVLLQCYYCYISLIYDLILGTIPRTIQNVLLYSKLTPQQQVKVSIKKNLLINNSTLCIVPLTVTTISSYRLCYSSYKPALVVVVGLTVTLKFINSLLKLTRQNIKNLTKPPSYHLSLMFARFSYHRKLFRLYSNKPLTLTLETRKVFPNKTLISLVMFFTLVNRVFKQKSIYC